MMLKILDLTIKYFWLKHSGKTTIWRYSACILLVVVTVFTFSACDFSWERYYNKEYRFSILLPRFWSKQLGLYDTIILAFEPSKGLKDNFRENVNVSVTNLEQKMSLSAFFALSRDVVLNQIIAPDASEGDVLAGLFPGKWLSFETYAKGTKIMVISTIFLKGNRAYIITCSSAAEKYPQYEPIFMKIIRSFRPR